MHTAFIIAKGNDVYKCSLTNLRRAGYMQCCLTCSGSRVPLSSVLSLSLLLLSRSDRLTLRRLGTGTDGAGEKNAEIRLPASTEPTQICASGLVDVA